MTDRSAAADAAFAESACADSPPEPATSDPAQRPPMPAVNGSPPTGATLPLLPASPLEDDESQEPSGRDWYVQLPSWLASTVIHLTLVLALALATSLVRRPDAGAPALVASTDSQNFDEGPPEELSAAVMESPDDLNDLLQPAPLADLPATAMATGAISPILRDGELQLPGGTLDGDGLMASVGQNSLQMRLDGRLRSALVKSGGGTPESEEAVLLALAWLAEHQNYDGSWSFQHHKHPKCNGHCGNPGYTTGKIAATSLALLPFLGTGQTQHEGNHKLNVEKGLKFLIRSIQYEGRMGSLWEQGGTMYGHGLAAIVLCEAYGMTHDVTLREPAQATINFIVEAQHSDGGWRYHPRTPGDTSVVGWQLMALQSAQMAYLRVPHNTLRKAGYFLDSVQGQRGAVYGYQQPDGRRPPTTAIGLLCRMYLGWNRDVQPLGQGVQILSTLGPSTDKTSMRNNMYYNYYATQVMHHWGGPQWTRWNKVMRDYLVNSQATRGHEQGSWYFDGADIGSGAGGRVYCTAMAAMTLEVYYRHMPLYRPLNVSN